MKRSENKSIRKDPALLLILTALAAVLFYMACAYPVYTKLKERVLLKAYRDIQEMDLSALGEEDEEVLQTFRTENLEILILQEDLEAVYSNTQRYGTEQIQKSIEKHLEEYQNGPTLSARTHTDLRVLRLRGVVSQPDGNYYVFLRRELRQVPRFIRYSTLYFLAAGAIALLLWALILRRKNLALAFVSPQEEAKAEKGRTQQQIAEAQKEFVANISHELKTPLAVISGQVEMLQSMGDEIDRDYYFESIREEIEKMSDLVGNLLDITIIDHDMEKMEMTEVNLSDMMEYMVLKYDALFCKNQIKLTTALDKNCIVRANRMYMEQAVNNYIMNAFQHTAQGGGIRISLAKEDGQARIAVYNDGLNIPKDDIGRIWQSFYKGGRRQKRKGDGIGNAGLGLYTVKKIVEQHGGLCGVENQEKGVEFWIQIPLMK